MKLISETESKLIFKKNNDSSLVALFIMPFFFIAGISLFKEVFRSISFSTSFECVRATEKIGNCQVSNQFVFFKENREFPLQQLYGAKVKEIKYENEDSTSTKNEVFILTSKGEEKLDFDEENDVEKQAIVTQIGSFIGNPRQTQLNISKLKIGSIFSGLFLFTLFGLPFIVFSTLGLFFVITAKFLDTISLDKSANLLTMHYKSYLESTNNVNYTLDQISDIEVEEFKDDDDNVTYNVKFVLSSGEKLNFHIYSKKSEYIMRSEVSKIRSFLNSGEDIKNLTI
jgi:hypothetical protein